MPPVLETWTMVGSGQWKVRTEMREEPGMDSSETVGSERTENESESEKKDCGTMR